jgi:uncharacterized protein YkwD
MPISAARSRCRTLTAGLVVAGMALGCAVSAVPASAVAPSIRAPRIVGLVAGTGLVTQAAATCADSDLLPTSNDSARMAAATLCLINQQRAAAGLPALLDNGLLDTAASGLSLEMVAQNFFDHTSPSGSTMLSRLTAVGYILPNTAWSIGENIAAATGSLATPAAMVTAWMNSPGHRANILDPDFQDTGIGVTDGAPKVVGSGAGGTYTEDFGSTS